MRQQSASSLSKFLGCPHAYKLHYIDGFRGEPTEDMQFGSWVEKQLTEATPEPDAIPFKAAFDEWLKKNDDEVVATQVKVEFEFEGFQFQGIVDFLTKKGKAIEIKVTRSPGYYLSILSHQVKLYNLGFRANKLPYLGTYLLMEVDKKEKKFIKLIEAPNVQTDLGILESANDLVSICKLVESSEKSGFPPSYNNCARCLLRSNCNHYFGDF